MTDAALIPCIRGPIIKEYSDGDLGVRIEIGLEEVDKFWTVFPDLNEAAYLADSGGAIQCTRNTVIKEYEEGSIAVRIMIEPQWKKPFRDRWPHPSMAAILGREDPATGRQAMMNSAIAAKPEYGAQARTLRQSINFLRNRKIWEAVGTDKEYQDYLRTKPCAHCKWTPHYEFDLFVPSEPAHVRRVSDGAGTAIKPKYAAIPLCPTGKGLSCHQNQHQQGESFLGGKEWVDQARINHVVAWVWESLKAQLGYDHWNDVPPPTLLAWAVEHGVDKYLPECYR